jgi:TRAP-type transport system periplasmic protein
MRPNDDSRGPGDVRGPTDRSDRRRSSSSVVQEVRYDRLAALPAAGLGDAAPFAGGWRSPWRRRAVVLVIASLAVLSACGAPDDAVAPDDEVAAAPVPDAGARTLRLAHIDGGTALDPPVDWFIEQVDAVSDGALTIELVTDCCGAEPDVEEQLVAAVASGEFDLGWVGTRVFEGLGVNELAALTAPALLDSYAVQQAVLASDIPQEMLDGLDAVGVEGVAVLPGSLRLPLAVEKPLLVPTDWQGVTFHTVRSAGNATTISALGATPVDVGFAARNAGLVDGSIQGLENSVIFHTQAAFDLAPYVTLNVRLWPRVSALLIDPEVLPELDDTELGWLQQAAANVVGRTRELAELDTAAIADGCAKGGRYALADDAELAAMSDALEPIIAELGQDTTTGEFIERIQELAESITAEQPPVVPEGCAADEPVPAVAGEEPETWDGSAIPDGTYEKSVTREEAVAAGVPVSFLDQPDEFLGIDEFHITIRLQDGHYQFLANYVGGTQVGDRGTYTYDASGRLVKTSNSSGCPGCTSVFEWSFEEDTLVLEVSEDEGDYPDWTEMDRAITRVYDAGTFQKTS